MLIGKGSGTPSDPEILQRPATLPGSLLFGAPRYASPAAASAAMRSRAAAPSGRAARSAVGEGAVQAAGGHERVDQAGLLLAALPPRQAEAHERHEVRVPLAVQVYIVSDFGTSYRNSVLGNCVTCINE
jgi:hypothetical protein